MVLVEIINRSKKLYLRKSPTARGCGVEMDESNFLIGSPKFGVLLRRILKRGNARDIRGFARSHHEMDKT